MEMNKELLAKAYVELKGDLNKTGGLCTSHTYLTKNPEGEYYTFKNKYPVTHAGWEYVCTVEEFNNYKPISETEYLLRTESNSKHLAESIKQLETVQKSKSPCQTKVNLREAKGTISAMETFMEEVGVLEAWNDNKELYLEGK